MSGLIFGFQQKNLRKKPLKTQEKNSKLKKKLNISAFFF